MTKKTITTADGTLDWEDAREGDFVRVNDTLHKVETTDMYPLSVRMDDGYCVFVFLVEELKAMGAILERDVEEHPHGLIPTAPGTTVSIGGVPYHRFSCDWCAAGESSGLSDEEVQYLADEYGFEVLVPESHVSEARKEGIRAVVEQ